MTDFLLTRDPQQKSGILEKLSLREIAIDLECLPNSVRFLTQLQNYYVILLQSQDYWTFMNTVWKISKYGVIF